MLSQDTKDLRMVIKNGSTYYISEFSITTNGLFTLNAFNNSSSTGKRWGVYTPSTLAFPSPLPSFSAVNFNDVQEIGIVYAGGRPAYGHSFNFTQFSVKAIVGAVDTQAPTVPAGLASSAITQTSCTLNWTASTDNVGVTGYEVFRNGTSIGTPTATTFNVSGLSASTAYNFTVRARDAAGNYSAQSNALSVTTQSASTGYRYLRVVALGGVSTYDIFMEEIDWLVGTSVYPTTNASSGSTAVTATNNSSNAYKVSDGIKNNTSIWSSGSTTYPQNLTFDLGAGVAINPTQVQISIEWNARAMSSFRCEGSNDNSNWTVLYTKSGWYRQIG